jgi:tRNA (adenine57-N1/adenine58-N1)-methyltransferase
MSMNTIQGKEESGIHDTESATFSVGGSSYKLRAGQVLDTGDMFHIKNRQFISVPFRPAFASAIAERGPQVILPHDASVMVSFSGITGGSRVIESGVGSGILSAFILWEIGEEGILKSIDINSDNIQIARKNLDRFGIDRGHEYIIGDIRNFDDADRYDAVFLDIPDPWNAMKASSRLLKKGGTLVTYSPNFNQVEKAVVSMGENNIFHHVSMELTRRNLIVRKDATRPDSKGVGHTGFISVGYRYANNDITI